MFSCTKKKVRSRIASLLAAVMLLTLLGLFSLPALATPLTNQSLQDAVDDHVGAAPPNAVMVLDLQGRPDLYGNIDVAELVAMFPNLQVLNVSSTNVTDITNVPGTVTIQAVDTFYSNERDFVVDTVTVLNYTEALGNLSLDLLLNVVSIESTFNPALSIPVPATMLRDNGTVEISGIVHAGVDPAVGVLQGQLLGLAPGLHTVDLNFPIAFSDEDLVATGIQLNISLGHYQLTPGLNWVHDGGHVYFTLTRYNAANVQIALAARAEYDVRLALNYGDTGLMVDPVRTVMGAGNMYMTIRIEAPDIPTVGVNTSAWLRVNRADTTPLVRVAQSTVVKYYNLDISNLWLREYMFDTSTSEWFPAVSPAANADVFHGDTLYISGGSSRASADYGRLIANLNNPSESRFMLRGTIGGNDQYVPASYYFQVKQSLIISAAAEDYVDFELIVVTHPVHGDVLALVFTARTMAVWSDTAAIHVEVDNVQPLTPLPNSYLTLDVQIVPANALGYKIYMVPEWYAASFTSRVALEDAIQAGHPGITLVAHYVRYTDDVNDPLFHHLIPGDNGIPGVDLVERSTVYLVATAYFNVDGRRFLLPTPLFADQNSGWYHQGTNPAAPFVAGWTRAEGLDGDTSIRGQIANTVTPPAFANGTNVLRLHTHAYGYDFTSLIPPYDLFNAGEVNEGEETEARLIFARRDAANNFHIPVRVVGAKPAAVFFAEQGWVAAPGNPGDLIAPMLPGAMLDPNHPLHQLNFADLSVAGTGFPIAIDSTEVFEVFTVYTNNTESRSTITATAPIYDDVTLHNPSVAGMTALVTREENAGDDGLFDIVIGDNAGANDALAGETINMTYTLDGLSRTARLVLGNSEVTGLSFVYRDYKGNYFSANPGLFNHFAEINELEDNFQVPYGTEARVYAVFAFSNSAFFQGQADWRTFVAPTFVSPAATLTYTIGDPALDLRALPAIPTLFRVIYGADTEDDIDISAVWTGAANVTFGGVTYALAPGTNTGTEQVDVTQPLLRGISVYDPFAPVANTPVANDDTIVGGVVGDILNPQPRVTRSGASNAGTWPGPPAQPGVPMIQAYLIDVVEAGTFLGDVDAVTMQISHPTYARAELYDPVAVAALTNAEDDYGLGLLQATVLPSTVEEITVYFTYTFTLNGIPHTVELNDANYPVNPDTYEFHVEIGHPRLERVFLVAQNSNPVNLTQRDDRVVDGVQFLNLYTLPFHLHSTFRVYPVALSSGARLAGSDFLDDLLSGAEHVITLDDVDDYSDYLSFMEAAHFEITDSPWTFINATNRALTSQMNNNATSGYLFANYTVIGPIQSVSAGMHNALRTTFTVADPLLGGIDLTAAGLEVYSEIVVAPATLRNPTILDVFHLAEANEVNVVDIYASSPTAPVSVGLPVEVDVRYFVSSDVLTNGVTYTVTDKVPATFFGAVLPGMDGYNVTAPNALRVTLIGFTPAGSATEMTVGIESAANVSYSGDYLEITPMLPGTYRFALRIDANNAGVPVPNFEPQFVEITFVAEKAVFTQTVYYTDVTPINFAATWTTAEEQGAATYLNAAALNGGFLSMEAPVAGTSLVYVYNGTVRVAEITVNRVTITAQDATLNLNMHQNWNDRLNYVIDGETLNLFWVVEYLASNGNTIFRNRAITDNVPGWEKLFTGNDGELILNGMMITVEADGDGAVAYAATHIPTGTVQHFWVEVDASQTFVLPTYVITDDENDITAVVPDLTLYTIGGSETLFVWNQDTGNLAEIVNVPPRLMTSEDSTIAVVTPGPTPESFVISAVSPGGPIMVRVYLVEGGYKEIPVTVEPGPTPAFTVSGQVRCQENNNPVPGATVTIVNPVFGPYTTTADGSGNFYFDDVPNGLFGLTATAPVAGDFGTGIRSVIVNGADVDNQDIILPPVLLLTVSGQVRQLSDGTPVPNAPVTIYRLTGGNVFQYTTTADSSGNYVFNNIPDGVEYRVIAGGPVPGVFGTGSVDVTLIGLNVIDHNIYLPLYGAMASLSVSGLVLDSNGDPVPGATVTIEGLTNGFSATVTASANPGEFIFPAVPDNDVYIVTATDNGDIGNISVLLDGAPVTGLDVTLGLMQAAATYTVSGEVRNADTNAVISVATVTITGPGSFTRTVTTTNGTFSFNVPDDATYTITATAGGFASNSINNVVVDGANVPNQNVYLTPGLTPTYTVTYNANGGSGTDSVTVNAGNNHTVLTHTAADISRNGYNFTGWNTAAGGTGTSYQPGDSLTVTGNVTLYAQWQATGAGTTYTVTYNANGGTGNPFLVQNITSGSTHVVLTHTAAGIDRANYTFLGWYTATSGGTNVAVGSSITVTGNVTLYARWQATGAGTTFTVTYNANGGSGSHSVEVPAGTNHTLLTHTAAGISRNGYNFTGWSTTTGTTHLAGSILVNVTANVTLYAQWTQITVNNPPGGGGGGGGFVPPTATYTVTVAYNGGGTAVANRTTAVAGETIRVTATPNADYEVESVIMTLGTATSGVTLSPQSDGTYTFTMPASNVTVTVAFEKVDYYEVEWPFSDVDPNGEAWFVQYVAFVYEHNIMVGSGGMFRPQANLNRAEMVQILWNLEGRPAAESNSFADVPSTFWGYEAINWAAENQIVRGMSDTEFAPTATITREQMVTILHRYVVEFKEMEAGESNNLLGFADRSTISPWALEAVEWAVGEGIIQGVGNGNLAPQDTSLRAQIAAVMYRVIQTFELIETE